MNLSHRLSTTFAATLLATVVFSAAASAGCGSCCCRATTYAAPAEQVYEQVDMTPRYIVNQGPVYDGPAIQVPVLTYSESLSAHRYPYVRSTRGYYVRGHGDVYSGGPYAHPMSHRGYRYGHRYHQHHHRHGHYHQSRVHGADGRALDVPVRPGVSVVRARAEVRYVGPERMEIKLQREQKPRKPRRHYED